MCCLFLSNVSQARITNLSGNGIFCTVTGEEKLVHVAVQATKMFISEAKEIEKHSATSFEPTHRLI
jgi:type IV secretory pathway TrbL component